MGRETDVRRSNRRRHYFLLSLMGMLAIAALMAWGLYQETTESLSLETTGATSALDATGVPHTDASRSAGSTPSAADTNTPSMVETAPPLPLIDVDQSQVDPLILAELSAYWQESSRYRIVTIDSDFLRELIRTNSNFEVNLFPDMPLDIVARDAREHHEGTFAGHSQYFGSIGSDRLSSAQLIVDPNGMVSGRFRVRGVGVYVLKPTDQPPFHVLVETNSEQVTSDAPLSRKGSKTTTE